MKATLISSGGSINLEIPLTPEDLERLKEKTPSYLEPEEYAEQLVLAEKDSSDKLDLNDELIARIRRDIIISYIEHSPTKGSDYILSEVKEFVNYCINK